MKKTKLSDKEYIQELEKVLIFMCDCYVQAKESVSCHETEDGRVDEKYMDLYMHFPMVQGEASFAVSKIAELRTPRGNKESYKMSMTEIFERMSEGRKTQSQIRQEVSEIVRKSIKNNH